MANRNLNFTPNVNNVVAEDVEGGVFSAVASIGANIAMSSAQSKLLESTAAASAGIKKLDMEYRLQNAHDPLNAEAKSAYVEKRESILNDASANIPLIARGEWQTKAKDLAINSDAQNELWAANQQIVNVKDSVNNAIQTYLGSAATDGAAFGASESADISAALGYINARGDIEKFATPVLGQQTTQKLLDDFNKDYIKTFVSGVLDTNPSKGLKLLDDPHIKDSMLPDEYTKFRDAASNRAEHLIKARSDAAVYGKMNAENSLLASGGKASYAQIQQAQMTPAAKEYFETLNGFKGTGKRGGFTPEDKAAYKLAIYDAVDNLRKDPNIDAASVRVVQDAIYNAMNKGAITQADGLSHIAQIVDPIIKKKESDYGKFGQYNWVRDSIGFDGIQEFYDKNVYKPTVGMKAEEKRSINAANDINKANLYDYYMGALQAKASEAGTTVAGLSELPETQRLKIYSSAQTAAQETFLKNKHPALRTLPDVPNFVFSDGKLIQGMTGKRAVEPTATASPTFSIFRHKKTGELYRVYKDGKIEKAQ